MARDGIFRCIHVLNIRVSNTRRWVLRASIPSEYRRQADRKKICDDKAHFVVDSDTEPLEFPLKEGALMEPNQQVEDQAELISETMVEEVSIDGMCGVY